MNNLTSGRKLRYRELSAGGLELPIFLEPWWLDSVCGANNWDVCLIESQGEVKALLPYFVRRGRLNRISMPPLTPCMGPWLNSTKLKYSERLSEEMELLQKLITQLPKNAEFTQNMRSEITNCLPFHWAGYSQSTRYTYKINDLTDLDSLWNNMRGGTRKEIRKAEKNDLSITSDLGTEKFIELHQATFKRQSMIAPDVNDVLARVYEACKLRSQCQFFFAVHPDNSVHAAAFVVWDSKCAYYLLGGGDPNLRTSGAASLVLWSAIKHASKVTEKFDFEGSMIKSIEKLFRGFGATQTPYARLEKTNHPAVKLVKSLRILLD